MNNQSRINLFPADISTDNAQRAGFRFGAKGTHTSRTMMFDELNSVLSAVGCLATRKEYASAIIDDNCLAKPTTSTRRLTNQRLGELYGLDPSIPVFRVFSRLWELDEVGRRQLALLCAIARDPLLASTASPVVDLSDGAEFLRDPVKAALRDVVGDLHGASRAAQGRVAGRRILRQWPPRGKEVQRRCRHRARQGCPMPAGCVG